MQKATCEEKTKSEISRPGISARTITTTSLTHTTRKYNYNWINPGYQALSQFCCGTMSGTCADYEHEAKISERAWQNNPITGPFKPLGSTRHQFSENRLFPVFAKL